MRQDRQQYLYNNKTTNLLAMSRPCCAAVFTSAWQQMQHCKQDHVDRREKSRYEHHHITVLLISSSSTEIYIGTYNGVLLVILFGVALHLALLQPLLEELSLPAHFVVDQTVLGLGLQADRCMNTHTRNHGYGARQDQTCSRRCLVYSSCSSALIIRSCFAMRRF